MLINISNHPSLEWSEGQQKVAIQQFTTIYDIAFPKISPSDTKEQIVELAQSYVKQILQLQPKAVHIMGEMNFTFACVTLLKAYNIKCLASTTTRNTMIEESVKISHFDFIQFREY